MVGITYFVTILGTAGSGKTSLASMLYTYLTSHQLDAILVNLDPAVEDLPYSPDVDARDYVNIHELMRKTGLGPNGALIASIDMLLASIEDIKDEIWSYKTNYVIIDTPGQMELFAFRQTGPFVLKAIMGDAKAVSVYIIDSMYALQPSNLFSALLLASSTYVRLKMPMINALTKIDLLEPAQLNKIIELFNDPASLSMEIMNEKESWLIWSQDEVYNMLEKLLLFDIIPISNLNGEGFDDLYAAIQRVVAGGEDYSTEEPSPLL
ncbi:MAG: ATP/GTP-binding protein [Desulfurococcaceae archaeon]